MAHPWSYFFLQCEVLFNDIDLFKIILNVIFQSIEKVTIFFSKSKLIRLTRLISGNSQLYFNYYNVNCKKRYKIN